MNAFRLTLLALALASLLPFSSLAARSAGRSEVGVVRSPAAASQIDRLWIVAEGHQMGGRTREALRE
jgi:hypothetical protein